jgi:histone-lysine N-methyltransferase SETD2
MVDASSIGQNSENIQFKIDLLSTLSSLPVPNKTMLLDSKLISIVEKWTTSGESETVKAENPSEIEELADNQTELSNQVLFQSSNF